ncbi:DUF6233 domain-containing protein [Streptomyces sp. NPDC050636]|uniref:DUF6233 domain-containing protein n=1 Tax=Streptomyces sp. NPDC050636 TaxID=3154510 RepID=UPI00341DDEFD
MRRAPAAATAGLVGADGARRWPAADRARRNCAHQGAAKGRPVGREEALRLLTDVGVESCGMCNPDRELGLP